MFGKPEIRNEHRLAYRAGDYSEIPPHILELLKEQEPQHAKKAPETKKAKAKEDDSE